MTAKLTTISTGSIGNAYILESCGEKLLLECGVRLKDILKALNFNLEDVVGCLVSHEHKDHALSIPNALKYGIKVYSTPDVASQYPKVVALEPMKRYSIGNWKVLPLKVPHGECECYAYHITMPDGQTCVFATDLENFPYNIPNVNFLFLECNYAEEIIIERMMNNEDARSMSSTHLELNTAIGVISRLYSPKMSKVVLLHLSDANSDESLFKKRIFEECGVRVEIAEKDKEFLLESELF